MKFRVRYRGARVTVEGEKPEQCAACPRNTMGGWNVGLHHYLYAYTTAQVRSDPKLVLDNTIPLCYQCHRIADMLRKMVSDPERTELVNDALIEKARGDVNGRGKRAQGKAA